MGKRNGGSACILCQQTKHNHIRVQVGKKVRRKCPDRDAYFQYKIPRFSASNSFAEGELTWLTYVITTLQRGGTVTPKVVAHSDGASVYAKVVRMKKRIADLKAKYG